MQVKRKINYKIFSLGILFYLFSSLFLFIYGKHYNFWPIVKEVDPWDGVSTKVNFFGPIFEQTYRFNEYHHTAFRPLCYSYKDQMGYNKEDYFLYPFFTYRCTPGKKSWSMFNFIHGSCYWDEYGRVEENASMAFPFFFLKRAPECKRSYFGVFPFFGRVNNLFSATSVQWIGFPLYFAVERGDTIRHGLPWPFIRWQSGPGAHGGAFWPLFGHYYKDNVYDYKYIFWPFIYKNLDQYEKPIPRLRKGFLPFFAYESSSRKEVKTYIWPFFNFIERRDKYYVEKQFPWPFFVQARGEDTYINRWAPFYTHSIRQGVDKKWLMWPMLKVKRWEEEECFIKQEQFLYFIFWRQTQYCKHELGVPPAKKVHLWPLISYWDNGAGRKQFQMFSPFEVFFPANQVIRKKYSPLFAFLKYEKMDNGYYKHSFLFDVVKSEKGPRGSQFSIAWLFDVEDSCERKGFEFLKGILGFWKKNGKKSLKILWLSL